MANDYSDDILTISYTGTPNRNIVDVFDSNHFDEPVNLNMVDLSGITLSFKTLANTNSQYRLICLNIFSINVVDDNGKVIATNGNEIDIVGKAGQENEVDCNYSSFFVKNDIYYNEQITSNVYLEVEYKMHYEGDSYGTMEKYYKYTFKLAKVTGLFVNYLQIQAKNPIYNGIYINSMPTTTTYYNGEDIDHEGLSVYVRYKSNITNEYVYGYEIFNYSITPNSGDIVDYENGSSQQVTINYNGSSVYFNLTVIDIDKNNTRVSGNLPQYALVGNTISDLNLPTLIQIYYTDGTIEGTNDVVWTGTFNKAGTTTITATYYSKTHKIGGTLSFDLNVYNSTDEIVSVELLDSSGYAVSTIYKTYKDNFTLDGYILRVNYNGTTAFQSVISGDHTTNPIYYFQAISGVNAVGINTELRNNLNFQIKITYNGFTATSKSYAVNVSSIPDKIVVTPNTISNVKKTDVFNKSSLEVKYYYKSGSYILITGFNCSLENNQQYGDTTQIAVKYTNEFNEEFTEYVSVQTLAQEVTSIEVATQPTKLSYVETDTLTIDGLVVKANYSNGYPASNISLSACTITLGNATGKKNGTTAETTDNGKKWYIQYGNYTCETNAIEVSALEMTGLVVTGVQTRGYIGDYLDKSSIVAYAVLNNDDNRRTDITATLEYSFDGKFTQVETKTLQITGRYDGKTITKSFSIQVGYADLDTLDIYPKNIGLKAGTVFNISEYLEIYPVYANGYVGDKITTFTTNPAQLPFLNESNIVSNDYGTHTFNIVYNLHSYPLTITINENKTVRSIKVNPNGKKYKVGDTYDASDITIQVQYVGDDAWKNYQGCTFNPAIGTLFKSAGSKKIIVSVGEVSVEYQAKVVISNAKQSTETDDYGLAFNVTELTIDDEKLEFGLNKKRLPLYHIDYLDSNNEVSNDNKDKAVGYIDFGTENVENAHLVLFDDPVNPIDGDGNIVVTFPHYISGYADRINKSTFGQIFNGRLFVSGNPEMPNYDWRTSAINTAQVDGDEYNAIASGDFTYFVDLHQNAYGSDHTAVLGYDTYSDGTLVVIKEDSNYEATMYYRTLSQTTATNSAGESISDSIEDNYPCFDINTNGGIGGISKKGVANYLGDTIFLTRLGLKRLVSKSTYNNEKVTIDVSTFVNSKITKEELNNASLYTFENKLLLKTNRGVYVAFNGLREDNEYEWYFLNNMDARLFFNIDNQLYFADENGNINRMNEGVFKDITRVFIGNGGIYTDGYLGIASKEYDSYIVEGNELHFVNSSNKIYAKIGSFISKNILNNPNITTDYSQYSGYFSKNENGDWYITLKDIDNRYYESLEVYAYGIKGLGLTQNKLVLERYYDNEPEIAKFYLVYNGEKVDLTQIDNFNIKIVINNISHCYIANVRAYNVDGEAIGKEFKLKDTYGYNLQIIKDASSQLNVWSGVITTSEKNVVSFYVSRPYDMGTLLYGKTIYLWSIANDTDFASYMDVGYYINNKAGDYSFTIKNASGSRALDFNFVNFDKVQFTSDKLPHIYTRQRLLQNVGFIRYIFQNAEDTNMVLSQMQLLYTYGQVMKGIK